MRGSKIVKIITKALLRKEKGAGWFCVYCEFTILFFLLVIIIFLPYHVRDLLTSSCTLKEWREKDQCLSSSSSLIHPSSIAFYYCTSHLQWEPPPYFFLKKERLRIFILRATAPLLSADLASSSKTLPSESCWTPLMIKRKTAKATA